MGDPLAFQDGAPRPQTLALTPSLPQFPHSGSEKHLVPHIGAGNDPGMAQGGKKNVVQHPNPTGTLGSRSKKAG